MQPFEHAQECATPKLLSCRNIHNLEYTQMKPTDLFCSRRTWFHNQFPCLPYWLQEITVSTCSSLSYAHFDFAPIKIELTVLVYNFTAMESLSG